jgi:hypothetical protein
VLDFLKSSSWTVLLDVVDDDPDDTPAVQDEMPPPYLVICLSDLILFVKLQFFKIKIQFQEAPSPLCV